MVTRSAEIFETYLVLIDQHLKDLLDGHTEEMFEIQDFAKQLFIHPTHFSNVMKEYTGKHACYFFEQKILKVAKEQLSDPRNSIAEVARKLTYDPSNFTKWFKAYAGISPSAYRKQLQENAVMSPAAEELLAH